MSTPNVEARRAAIRHMIDSAGSTIFSVTFMKRTDGSFRTMNIQLPAIKNRLVGDAASDRAKKAVATRKENHPSLLPVYSIDSQGIRSLDLDLVTEVNLRGYTARFPLPERIAA